MSYRALSQVSLGCSRLRGRSPTYYSPVRHFSVFNIATKYEHVRLACVKHAASVSPEPGSNSPQKFIFSLTPPCGTAQDIFILWRKRYSRASSELELSWSPPGFLFLCSSDLIFNYQTLLKLALTQCFHYLLSGTLATSLEGENEFIISTIQCQQ